MHRQVGCWHTFGGRLGVDVCGAGLVRIPDGFGGAGFGGGLGFALGGFICVQLPVPHAHSNSPVGSTKFIGFAIQ